MGGNESESDLVKMASALVRRRDAHQRACAAMFVSARRGGAETNFPNSNGGKVLRQQSSFQRVRFSDDERERETNPRGTLGSSLQAVASLMWRPTLWKLPS